MASAVSSKSELARWDAACALAMLLREVCEQAAFVVFSDRVFGVPPRRGFGLRDVLRSKAEFSGTNTGLAVTTANAAGYDRIIVLTDEQSRTVVPNPLPESKAYMVNVASDKNGVGYGQWTHIDGWSEAILDYIQQYEAQ